MERVNSLMLVIAKMFPPCLEYCGIRKLSPGEEFNLIVNRTASSKIRAIARNQKLSDVYAPTITGGDVLRWNSTTLRFEVFNITSALSNKVDTSRTITAGNGLTGGGDLTADRTINIANADDSLVVAADSIKVNTNNTLTSTSTTQPLSANQGKVLNEKVAQVETELKSKLGYIVCPTPAYTAGNIS